MVAWQRAPGESEATRAQPPYVRSSSRLQVASGPTREEELAPQEGSYYRHGDGAVPWL